MPVTMEPKAKTQQEKIEETKKNKPKYQGVIEPVFCNNKCLWVDQIMVPFPDCCYHSFRSNRILVHFTTK